MMGEPKMTYCAVCRESYPQGEPHSHPGPRHGIQAPDRPHPQAPAPMPWKTHRLIEKPAPARPELEALIRDATPRTINPEPEVVSKTEAVNHPAHYGGDTVYETIKVLKAWLTPEEYRGFLKGNVIKYLSRAGKKPAEDRAKDTAKATWYQKELDTFEAGR